MKHPLLFCCPHWFRWGPTFALSATLLSAFTPAAQAVDVELFGVHKGQLFIQTNDSAPVAAGVSNYFFTAFVRAKRFNTVTDVLVRPQAGSERRLVRGHDFDFYNFWTTTDWFSSQPALDFVHPNTNYVVTVNTVNDGPVVVPFNLTGDAYPNAPHVANYTNAQAVRPEVDFLLQWDAFTGGTTNDQIRVDIEDIPTANNLIENGANIILGARTFRSGEPRDVTALDGTATSVLIPAGTLNAGHNYRARITFVKVTGLDTSYPSVPAVIGVAGYLAKTEFNLHTVDVRRAGVLKGQLFNQTNSSPATSQGFYFQAFVDSRDDSLIQSAIVTPPSGPLIVLPATNGFSFTTNFTTPGGLDAVYPDGTYQFAVTTVHDSTKTFSLSLMDILDQMANPQIANFNAAQAINLGQDFTLTWDPLGGTTNDYVQLTIRSQSTGNNGPSGKVYQSPPPRTPNALHGLSTSATVPAYTFKAGTTYSAELFWARAAVDTNTYTSSQGIGGDMKKVTFTMRTPDVRAYALVKRQEFIQTNNTAPVAASPTNFLGILRVHTPGTNNVTVATATLPANPTLPSQINLQNGNSFGLTYSSSSQSALDAALATGTYTYSLGTVNDGLQVLNLTLPATAFPNVPQVNSYFALQSVNPHAPLTISWNAFTGGTPGDFIQLEIVNTNSLTDNGDFVTVFNSPAVGEKGALNGTNTSIWLPANTFSPGHNYLARLYFVKIASIDLTSYPGSVGSVRFTSLTSFNVHTHGTQQSAPIIAGVVRTNAQTFLQFFGETNWQHRVDFVNDLKLKNWTPLTTLQPTVDGSNAVTDGQSGMAVRYYRVVPLIQ